MKDIALRLSHDWINKERLEIKQDKGINQDYSQIHEISIEETNS